MASICLYLKAHQPYRIKKYRVYDVGYDHDYFSDKSNSDLNNEKVLRKIYEKSYLPTNTILLELLKNHPEFKVSFSLTGTLIEQLEDYAPDILDTFRKLASTGRVEILGETYHHTLSFFYDIDEFEKQVERHRKTIEAVFGITPKILTNTELAYNNKLAKWADEAGYKAIVAEGWDPILQWRSPNFVYQPVNTKKIRLLLKNYKLSDDIAFRFSDKGWNEWPLTVEKFGQWVSKINGNGTNVNLFMDYETFGEHQWEDTGIFEFLKSLPNELLKHPDNEFLTPSEVVGKYPPVGRLDVPHILTWADTERDLSAWTGNDMQKEAIETIYNLKDNVISTKDKKLIEDWRKLQTSDHFYYMCTKYFADGDVHKYFNPYDTPYDAFIVYMNVLTDLKLRIKDKLPLESS